MATFRERAADSVYHMFSLCQLCPLVILVMSPPEGLGDILFFPGRPDVRLSVRLSVTNRVRSVT